MKVSQNSPPDLPSSGSGNFALNELSVGTVVVTTPVGTGYGGSDDSRAASGAVSLPAGPSTPDFLHHLIEMQHKFRLFHLAAPKASSSQSLSPSVPGSLDLSVTPPSCGARCCPSA